MKHSSLSKTLLGAAALAAAGLAGAQTIRRDTVVPVRFEDTIRLSQVKVGDPIRARADDNRDVPRGSVFEGRVRGVRRPRDRENGFVELEFLSLRTPDGQRYDIRATPVPLDDRYTSRDRDGRVTIRKSTNVGSGTAVIGGGLAGFALGSLIRKPLEGTIVGVLGGIAVAESQRSRNTDVIIDRNTRMGAAFQTDFDLNGRYDDRDDQADSDHNRDDQWNRDHRGDRDRDGDWNDDRRDDYTPRITYHERVLLFEGPDRPRRIGDTFMLPLVATARQLDLDVDQRDAWTVLLRGPDGRIRITKDSDRARIDGRDVRLDRSTVVRHGTLYVPAEVFGMILRENFIIDGTTIRHRSY